MVRTNELKESVEKSGLKLAYIADGMGITRQSLSNKINNLTEFTATEIIAMTKILKLSASKRDYIFLSQG